MSTEATLKRIESKVDKLSKPCLVGGSKFKELTGFTDNQMAAYRKNNPEAWKLSKKGGYLYDLNFLHPYLLKSKQHNHEQ